MEEDGKNLQNTAPNDPDTDVEDILNEAKERAIRGLTALVENALDAIRDGMATAKPDKRAEAGFRLLGYVGIVPASDKRPGNEQPGLHSININILDARRLQGVLRDAAGIVGLPPVAEPRTVGASGPALPLSSGDPAPPPYEITISGGIEPAPVLAAEKPPEKPKKKAIPKALFDEWEGK